MEKNHSLYQSNIKVIAHRGYWLQEDEKNCRIAFERAFDNNFGVETDLRDIKGTIVISHDMPKGEEMTFEELLKILDGRNLLLALNIKADGLADEIKRLLQKYKHTNYFTFDMSIPEMIYQLKLGLKVFSGLSDIVKTPVLFNEASGIWLDSFYSDWFDKDIIMGILNKNKQVCIVSPELHNRGGGWLKYKNVKDIMVCTDLPKEAEEFFNAKN